ncbi:hypothetical protein Bxe_A3359 [Paraburkholderia xenovorans LB400]|uniref:Uncharacterized protein n=1 Tax=Paraburkholderia xenovorans (strain LB400) TaxID=266265 RepID=Q142W3_PARXL|nr:hypothetical protein Bxe_A3359 [Paraburkholderia xenovorans LB400]
MLLLPACGNQKTSFDVLQQFLPLCTFALGLVAAHSHVFPRPISLLRASFFARCEPVERFAQAYVDRYQAVLCLSRMQMIRNPGRHPATLSLPATPVALCVPIAHERAARSRRRPR